MKKFLLALSLYVALLFSGEPVDILFYLQDAGETYAMMPVMQELKKQDVSMKVLALGVAAGLVPAEFDRVTLEGEPTLALLDKITPRVVMTGVAYPLQGQVLEAYRQQGVFAVAYWDNFSAKGENAYFQTAQGVASHATQVFVPTQDLASAFPQGAKVVGQPTLEKWVSEVAAVNPCALRQRMGLCSCREVVTFIGGYGAAYEDSLRLFIASMQKYNDPNIYVLVQPHPKVKEGAVERSLLEGSDFSYRVLRGELTTQEAVALSSVVCCHESTVAFQATAAGKPVIHFIPAAQTFTSVLLEKGAAQKVVVPADFTPALELAKGALRESDFFELVGTPRNSASIAAEALLELLR